MDRLPFTADHADFLKKRGLSLEVCARLGMTSQGTSLAFTYLSSRGETLFSKHRSHDKRFFIQPKGVELRLFNLPALAKAYASGAGDTLIITEGEFDCAACVQSGFEVVTSVPNGAPPVKPRPGEIAPHDDKAFGYLWDDNGLRKEVAQFKRFIIFTDNDEPGINLRNELMLRLGAEKCYVPVYPEDCKDANDILLKHGESGVKLAILNAFPLVPDTLTSLSNIPKVIRDRRWKSGWRTLDENLIVCPPELIVVTGKPNAGKSTFALAWMLNITRVYGVPGAVIQFEDNIERARWEVNTYVDAWKDTKEREVHDAETGEVDVVRNFTAVPDFADRYLRFVAPSVEEEDKRDLEWLRATIREAACRHGCGWVIVDPWNEIEHLFDRNVREDQYHNNALRELKKIARQYQIALVIVAHPDKSGGRNESIDEMTLYSISGGAAWKNKADHGVIIGREVDSGGVTGNTVVKVDKSKDYREMGVPGQKTLLYDRDKNQFTSLK